MNKSDFDKLTLQQKGMFTFENGKYIAVRYYYNHAVNLYSLYNFFVEVFYFPVTNKITKIESLKDEKTINIYINSMLLSNGKR